jgi:site-specific recombinase XerD
LSDLDPLSPEKAVEMYLNHRRGELADETFQSHGYRLERFVEWCDENEIRSMTDVTGRDLHAYHVARREEGLKPISLQGQLSTLRVFLGFCASIDAVPQGLRSKIMLPTVSSDGKAREPLLDHARAEEILEYLGRYRYASREHLSIEILWRTGIRSGGLRALDLEDYDPDDLWLRLKHRPDEGTPLKNGTDGERYVAIDGSLANTIDDYVEGPRRETRDEFERRPLLTTTHGRPTTSTLRDVVYRWTRPCVLSGSPCPHDRDPETCEAKVDPYAASKCPPSRSPHDVRSGAITAHLLDDVPVEILSDRMDVSQDVLDRHYDRRTEREKMDQRRRYL